MSHNNVKGCLGVSQTGAERAELDYYATCPEAAEWLIKIEDLNKNIWECAAGEKHIANVFTAHGYNVRTSDIVDRTGDIEVLDFLQSNEKWQGDIVTNPPFKYADDFIKKALESVEDGAKVCMFLKVQFLEGKARRKMYEENPPVRIWVSSSRLECGRNGVFQKGMVAYAWYIWEKGYKGDTIIKWFN